MYKIMGEGGDVAIVDRPVYIRRHENGSFVQTEREHAQGIAIKGTPYNLLGAKPIDEGFETVWTMEINGGDFIFEQQSAVTDLQIALVGMYETIAEGGGAL